MWNLRGGRAHAAPIRSSQSERVRSRGAPDRIFAFTSKLCERRIPFRLMLFECADQGLTGQGVEADGAARSFLDRSVRDLPPRPSMEPSGD